MPEITRQKKSGALIFTPTLQEETMVETQKALDERVKNLDKKIEEVDELLAELRKKKEQ